MIKGNYKWILEEGAKSSKNRSSKYIIDSILEKRGISEQKQKDFFLHPKLEAMYDPMQLPDMDQAVNRILEAKKKQQKITIYGDYDVDGITSTSILYLFLTDNNCIVDYYIPDRTKEGYGLNEEAIKTIKDNGTDLLITVDTGISDLDEVEFAKTIGLDTIITDHHECMESLPKAVAVINPKRLDSKYPFKELAGVGVAFKLIHAIAINLDKVDSIWKYIDIVAIGTVADIVPLVDENRIIVKNAFKTIPTTWNVGLESLLKVSGYKSGKITSGTVGFQVAPRINAAGRLGDAETAVELFTTGNKEKALKIAEDLDLENTKRKQIEQDIFEQAVDIIENSKDIKENNILIVSGEDWHKGVVGIVASRLSEKYYKPSIVFSVTEEVATGSARSISGFSIFEAISKVGHLTTNFGGHNMAAGITIEISNLEDFTEKVNRYANNIIDEEMLTKKIKIDCVISEKQANLNMIEDLEVLEPYGVGNPTPIFVYEGIINEKQVIGKTKTHLKLKLRTNNKLIESIGFNMSNRAPDILKGDRVEVVCNLQKNEWMGKVTPQLVLKDIKLSKKEIDKSNFYISLYKIIPKPKYENLKEFTNIIKTCYIHTYRKESLKFDNKFYVDEFEYLIPTRNDIAIIYRHIRNLENSKIKKISIHTLTRALKDVYITEYKILQALNILLELRLISYEYNINDSNIQFELLKGNTNPLKNSKEFINLSKIRKERTIK